VSPPLRRVRHIAIACPVEPALRFYRDALGLSVVADGPDASGRRSVTLPVGLSAILLVDDSDERGIDHLAFDVEDEDVPRSGQPLDAASHLGLRLSLYPAITPPPAPEGRVKNIDHVVIASGDSAKVAAHFRDALGLEIKRTMTRPGTNAHLEFGKLYDVTIEFVGPPEPRPGPLTAAAWGIVFTVDDIDFVADALRSAGYPVDEPRTAVQPGAKIAGVKTGSGGVPLALIQYNALGSAAISR
jgi:catechol 2,3-dioxygenase-like lactoylglutathione lyase family enzyme